MVYCGKASEACQHCRTRRIRCDKLRPDCSQCIRAGKSCPGYRDQLSLLFRDESTKVIQKANARGRVATRRASTSRTSGSSCGSNSNDSPSESPTSPFPSTIKKEAATDVGSLSSSVMPSIEERGFQFWVNNYLVGHPDEPRNPQELESLEWFRDPGLRDVLVALGLAGLSNVNGDCELMRDARQRYGKALRAAADLTQSSETPNIDTASQLVLQLAMFELVQGTRPGAGCVHAHLAGAAALIRCWFPMQIPAGRGIRSLLHLCYAMLLIANEVWIPLPLMFHDWVNFSLDSVAPEDRTAAALAQLMTEFTETSFVIRSTESQDGGEFGMRSALEKLVDIEAQFITWEQNLDGAWRYKTETGSHLPPSCVFDGEYHVYFDTWTAQVWNHYRWARILINQSILDLSNKDSTSSQPLVPAEEHQMRVETMKAFARDILVSTPSHWRHPLLTDKAVIPVEQSGLKGAGAAALPVFLFQLQLAACTPGVPHEYWKWSYDILDSVWKDMGMQLAKAVMEAMKTRQGLSFRKPWAEPGALRDLEETRLMLLEAQNF